MAYDTYFVVGLFILVLALPAIARSLRRGTPPRVPAIMFLIGGGLVALAMGAKPDAYTISTIPQVIDTVLTRLMAYVQA